MGILCHAIKIPRLISPVFLWTHVKLIIMAALTHLGLYKSPPQQQQDDPADDYIFILDGTCPCLIPIPIQLVISVIKNRVPILHYCEFVALKEILNGNQQAAAAVIDEEKEVVCTICLEKIDGNEEVRDLSRCSHVFHRDCLDKWVDSGQVTCPLCRSLLIPPKTNLLMSAQNSSTRK